jgi:hypothetical protein
MTSKSDENSCLEWEIKVAKSIEEIEAVRDIWTRMQNSESMSALNSDIDRYLTVVDSLEQEIQPYIIVLYCDGSPKAMVIGRIENRQIKCRIGYTTIFKPSLRCLGIVYGGILGQPSEQVCSRLVQELTDTQKRGEVDVVFFNHLRIDSHIYRLSRRMTHFLCRDYFPVIDDHWQTYLPETAEKFYAGIKRKRKKEWKRLGRRLGDAAGGPLKLECYDNVSQLEHFIEIASKISAMSYKDALNIGFSGSSFMHSVLTQAANRHNWRAYVLYAGQVPCAFETGIIHDNIYFAEFIGYSPEWSNFSPGTLLFVKVLEDLSQNTPLEIFDYGFGSAGYKERFGTKSWSEVSVYIFAPRLKPVVINILRSSIGVVSSTLHFIVQKIGSVGWIKRRWRNLLQPKKLGDKYVIEE